MGQSSGCLLHERVDSDRDLVVADNCDNVDSLGVAKVDIKLGAPSRQKVLQGTNHSVFGTVH